MSTIPAFDYLFEPALIKEMEKEGRRVHLDAGETLLEIGQPVQTVPIVLAGNVKVSRRDQEGRELLLYYINPMESCAMSINCCVQKVPSEIKATAEEEVDVLYIPIQKMDEWMMKYVTWKNFILKTISIRFNELLRTIDQIAFQKLDERLIRYLKEKSKVTGSTVLNLSHEQIAHELATSRVVISRLLKVLENQQKVLLYRNQIKLLKNL
ncbi:MAG TPA: Crp/Fnr family transcriptional regulator [Saprospiraceae bacterium]|nr:Crp/Fnr family transcriptional regulator [Saprospiraceae bacterium]HNT22681.1 Crp/Fnr family transcriptional regulator [Saprospiraceae bacterium]